MRAGKSIRSYLSSCMPFLSVIFVVSLLIVPRVATGKLAAWSSRHYTIYTNLSKSEARPYAYHMDTVFDEYNRRFRSFRAREKRLMPLYLFCSRDDYSNFLGQHGIDATGSGGMFFIRPGVQGLATWTRGKTRSDVIKTLQHEGFHQFAFAYLGPDLPIWVNEGLAEYFQDGLIVQKRMKLGLATDTRVRFIQQALRSSTALDFDYILQISSDAWSNTVRTNPERGRLLYDQSWSIVHFLIHAKNGAYREAFEKYLRRVAGGWSSSAAFAKAFGTSRTSDFQRLWRSYATALEPDPLNTTLTRMMFLAQGLRMLRERDEPMPETLEGLRTALQALNFRLIRRVYGLTDEMSSFDESFYVYPLPNGGDGAFELLEPARNDLPPRISAPVTKPSPTLTWSIDADGQPVSDIEYR